jgi:arylformamidase
MKIHDISVGVAPGMPVWPGSPDVVLERVSKIEEGANSNGSHLSLGVHTGTHLDAPFHFIPGAPGIDRLPLDALIGRALVIHLPRVEHVTAADLQRARIASGTRRLLIRTRNSQFWAKGETEFQTNFAAVTPDAAEWIVARGFQLVGVDYLSVAQYKNSRPTHEILLRSGVVVVEGLNLARIKPGRYELACLPLKLVGSDGAPARAVLIER